MDFVEFVSHPAVIWFFIGLIFLLLEFMIPGLIVLFFGFGAWITALFCLLFDLSINAQLIIFISTSLMSLLFLRRYFKKVFVGEEIDEVDESAEEIIGKIVSVTSDIDKGKNGKVLFKGAAWSASSKSFIKKGESAKIIGKDSIVLKVEPVDQEDL